MSLVGTQRNGETYTRTYEHQKREIKDRMKYFYMRTDYSYEFPNSLEGGLLSMVKYLFELEEDEELGV